MKLSDSLRKLFGFSAPCPQCISDDDSRPVFELSRDSRHIIQNLRTFWDLNPGEESGNWIRDGVAGPRIKRKRN